MGVESKGVVVLRPVFQEFSQSAMAGPLISFGIESISFGRSAVCKIPNIKIKELHTFIGNNFVRILT